MQTLFIGFIGMWETVAILAIVLVLFGAKKVPELAKGLGQGIKEFKKATNEVQGEIERAWDEPANPAPAKPKAIKPAPEPALAENKEAAKAPSESQG